VPFFCKIWIFSFFSLPLPFPFLYGWEKKLIVDVVGRSRAKKKFYLNKNP
jgi:hypothetical protein